MMPTPTCMSTFQGHPPSKQPEAASQMAAAAGCYEWPVSPAPAATLTVRVVLIIKGLQGVLAAHMPGAEDARPLLMLVWNRLNRLNRRIATLAGRFAAGLPVGPRLRPAAEPIEAPPPARATATSRLRSPVSQAGSWAFPSPTRSPATRRSSAPCSSSRRWPPFSRPLPQLKRQLRGVLHPLMPELPPSLALPPKPPRPPRPKAELPGAAERPKPRRRAPCHGARRPREFWRPGPIRPHWTA